MIRYSAEEAFARVKQVIKEADDLDERAKNYHNPNVLWYRSRAGLELLAEGLSVEQIIDLHRKGLMRLVYAIGFAPGFAYMGEIDASLATAHLSNPRKKWFLKAVSPSPIGKRLFIR